MAHTLFNEISRQLIFKNYLIRPKILTLEDLPNFYSLDFNAREFQSNLRTEFIGRSFIYRHLVDSTMNVAQREEQEGCAHGTLVLAECQSQGVGRGGRDWLSQPNVRARLYSYRYVNTSTTLTRI